MLESYQSRRWRSANAINTHSIVTGIILLKPSAISIHFYLRYTTRDTITDTTEQILRIA